MTDIFLPTSRHLRSHPFTSYKKQQEEWKMKEKINPPRILGTLSAGINYSVRARTIASAKKRDAYAVGTRDELRNYRDDGPYHFHFHQRYHAATMTPTRKRSWREEAQKGRRSNRLHVRYSYAPFCTYALARALVRRWKREIATTLQEGPVVDVLFFSLFFARLEEKETQRPATLFFAFCPRMQRESAVALVVPSILLQLGIITRARAAYRAA